MATAWQRPPQREASPKPAMVRRFTEELEPSSDLAIQTKLYQKTMDDKQGALEKSRMDLIYDPPIESNSPFSSVEIARQSLQSLCDEYLTSLAQKNAEQATKRFHIRLPHRSLRKEEKLVNEIYEQGLYTVEDVNSLVGQLEEKWKESHSRAVTYFNRICEKLHAHKAIFACFPNEPTYTSAICGAVTMIVQASVNYSTIPDDLSGYIAELSDSVSVCTKWSDLFRSRDIQARLGTIYKQFFDFFIIVATYYLKKKASQWLDAFNSSLADEYKQAVEKVRRSIKLLDQQAHIEIAGDVKDIVPQLDQAITTTGDRIVDEVRRNRLEYTEATALVGKQMVNLLLEQFNAYHRQEMQQMQRQIDEVRRGQLSNNNRFVQEAHIQNDSKPPKKVLPPADGFTRTEAEAFCAHVLAFVDRAGGSDGIKLAVESGPLIATPIMMEKLAQWLEDPPSDTSRTLWIMGSYELGAHTTTRAAAFGVIRTAAQAKAQFLSYVCEYPPADGTLPSEPAGDEAGIQAMVCSLIYQLLQFRPPDDDVCIAPRLLEGLTEEWYPALELLEYLLQNTRVLRYCIIADMNRVEGGAEMKCREFIQMLFSFVDKPDCSLRVLFTTSGQSAVLNESVPMESTLALSGRYHRLKRRGQYREIDLP